MFDTAPYYLILLVAAFPALSLRKKNKLALGWLFFGFLLILFIGLRNRVGMDWGNYLYIADRLRDSEFYELFQHEEVIFNFLVWSSVHMGLEIYGANVATTAIFLFGLFKYCQKQINPWMAVFTSLPFLVIVVAMSANRQAAAVGVTLLILAGWNESNLVKKLLLISIATLFHTSAIIFALFLIVDRDISIVKKAIFCIAIFLFLTVIIGSGESASRYETSYVTGADIYVSAGAFQQIMLNALPALIFLIMSFRSRYFRKNIPHWNVIFAMCILSIILIPISFFYSVAAARISFYLFPISISVLSTLPELFSRVSSRETGRFFVVIYGFLILLLWLNFANNASRHIPYNNLLFQYF